jgi:RNA polymerase sigma factor (sigma-70 family)
VRIRQRHPHSCTTSSVVQVVSLPPFQRLVDAHWRDVARLAHALAGPVDGDDVAQQAWAQALAGYPRLRSSENLRSWLLTVTARCATDAHRARARRPASVPDVAATAAAVARAPVAAGADEAWFSNGALWSAVRALPERQRSAVALRYIADLDHGEIARRLGTTPAATRRLVSDALATLRGAVPASTDSDASSTIDLEVR